MLHFEYFAVTDSGEDRGINEDRVLIDGNLLQNGEVYGQTDDRLLAAICDGFGGEERSGEAAGISAVSMRSACNGRQYPLKIMETIYKTNRKVLDKRVYGEGASDIRADLATLYIDDYGYLGFNVGNVRIYSVIEGRMNTLTETYPVQIMENECADCQKSSYDNRTASFLSKYYMGMRSDKLYVSMSGDISKPMQEALFLICSDGLFCSISHEEIESMLANPSIDIAKTGRDLQNVAKQNTIGESISLALINVSQR